MVGFDNVFVFNLGFPFVFMGLDNILEHLRELRERMEGKGKKIEEREEEREKERREKREKERKGERGGKKEERRERMRYKTKHFHRFAYTINY